MMRFSVILLVLASIASTCRAEEVVVDAIAPERSISYLSPTIEKNPALVKALSEPASIRPGEYTTTELITALLSPQKINFTLGTIPPRDPSAGTRFRRMQVSIKSARGFFTSMKRQGWRFQYSEEGNPHLVIETPADSVATMFSVNMRVVRPQL